MCALRPGDTVKQTEVARGMDMRKRWVSACLVGLCFTLGVAAPGARGQEEGGGGAESSSSDPDLSGLSSDPGGDPTGENDVLEGSKFAG